MARRKKSGNSGPNNMYLLSFGDTMTALLAFFIVLNSLAEEQTGANLYEGTGSFVRALESFGLPGLFSGNRSDQAFQFQQSSPHYLAPSEVESPETESNPSGPDPVDVQDRVLDYEQESFERFLHELDRLHETTPQRPVAGEVNFDRINPLPSAGPLLDDALQELLIPIVPLLRNPNYQVEIVVWSTTPRPSAWTRAAESAERIRQEAVALWRIPSRQATQLTAVGQPWISSTAKRPSVSVVVRRLRQAADR